MIFGTIKLIVWMAGVAVIAYFALPYFGYRVNLDYWQERRAACEARLQACQRDLIKTGIEGAKEKCDFRCVDAKSLIQKVENSNRNQLPDTSNQ